MSGEYPEFRCPITMDIMRDPVMAPDGHTYERSAIVQALAAKSVSPLTRQPMSAASLLPNHALRAAIEHWSRPQAKPSAPPPSTVEYVYIPLESTPMVQPRGQTVTPQSRSDYRRGCATLVMFVLVVFIFVVWMSFIFH